MRNKSRDAIHGLAAVLVIGGALVCVALVLAPESPAGLGTWHRLLGRLSGLVGLNGVPVRRVHAEMAANFLLLMPFAVGLSVLCPRRRWVPPVVVLLLPWLLELAQLVALSHRDASPRDAFLNSVGGLLGVSGVAAVWGQRPARWRRSGSARTGPAQHRRLERRGRGSRIAQDEAVDLGLPDEPT